MIPGKEVWLNHLRVEGQGIRLTAVLLVDSSSFLKVIKIVNTDFNLFLGYSIDFLPLLQNFPRFWRLQKAQAECIHNHPPMVLQISFWDSC